MLVNPEFVALLNRLNQTTRETLKKEPRVKRGENISEGGSEKPRTVNSYAPENTAGEDEKDYLNERESSVSFYA